MCANANGPVNSRAASTQRATKGWASDGGARRMNAQRAPPGTPNFQRQTSRRFLWTTMNLLPLPSSAPGATVNHRFALARSALGKGKTGAGGRWARRGPTVGGTARASSEFELFGNAQRIVYFDS